RLNPTTVYVLGGPSVVSEAVVNQLKALSPAPTVIRVSGINRYQTAVEITKRFFATGDTDLYVATGLNFPDALAAGAAGQPLLLTTPDALPPNVGAEATRLNPVRIAVVGGPTVISETVVNQLKAT
ncbi:MAG: cell wall-binding repeat-containing protein, partial [Candidatus Limnocylindria bacterium]